MPISAASSGGYEFYYQLAGSYYKAHAFFHVGSHTINFIGDGDVDYLVVAGGGSGSTGASYGRNSGGGAGGFRTGILGVSSGNKTVIVGDGGVPNSNGQDSTFDSITSAGGGRGGTANANGINGGSGGGGGGATTASRAGGLGNVPATDPPQGNNGSANNLTSPFPGGCGGGAGSVGLLTEGGSGLPSNITGIELYYAGGGGAQGYSSAPARPGGVGGGGNGGQPGSPYTGGGGGGGQRGGSGIVVIRYQITEEEYNANYQQPPYILAQPEESVGRVENTSYTLSVEAVDYPSGLTPSIQWQVSTDGGQSWSNISGATSFNYTATAQFSDNGNLYRAFLSGSNNSTYSENVNLSVYTAPVITLQPNSIETNPGSITLTSTATSSPSPPTVQWQISTDDGSTWTDISGATSSNYTKLATINDDGSMYRTVWTNIDAITISNAVTLSVYGLPIISTNLNDGLYIIGQNTNFNCTARGYPVPVGQWQVSTDNGSTWQNTTEGVATATTSAGTTTYNYNPGVASIGINGYKYRLVLTNSSGSVTSDIATLEVYYLENVIVGNVISSGAGSGFRMRAGNQAVVAINRGGRGISGLYKANSNQRVLPTATFSVSYDSYPEPNIQWQTSLDGITWNDISGANSTTYTKQVQSSDNNTFYRASIANPGMPFDYLKRSVVHSQTATLILSDSNWAYADTGGTITTFSQNGSNWRCHTFDTSGSHSINFTSPGMVEYLIIGGGGGGGLVYFRSWGYHFIGGGGAGGYRTGYTSVVTGESAITVGNGGAIKTNGGLSSFNGIESAGGGGGGNHHSGQSFTGVAGGSGGGSGRGGGAGGAGNTPAVAPSQGNRGGQAGLSGGGGGGAGGAGQSYVNPQAGPGRYGGLGLASDITGNIVIRATGGSAGDRSLNTAEPGNGGRGNGQTGFDGQVVIRYKI